MNSWLKWFSRLTVVGIVANLAFCLTALLSPDVLEALLGPGSTEFAIYWVPYAGFLLLVNTLLYIPAARDPLGLPVYAWLSVVGRGLATAFWLWSRERWHLPGLIETFWILDGALCVLFLVLLQLGMPAEHKISITNLSRMVSGWGRGAQQVLRPGEHRNGALRLFGVATWVAVLASLWFAVPALVDPAGAQQIFHGVSAKWAYLWLGNCGFLLIQLCLYLLPAAAYPVRYRGFAWASAAIWLSSSAFWLWLSQKWAAPAPISWFWVVDGAFGAVLLLLLQRGMPEGRRFSLGAVILAVGDVFGALARALASPLHLVMAVALLAIGAFGVQGLQHHLFNTQADPIADDPEEHFKYGAIGLAIEARVPLYLWEVLPELCGDKLPDPSQGMASLGLIYEDGKNLPIGFAERNLGYPTVEPNCALCHVGNYRQSAGGPQQLALGGSAHMLDLQAFQWFLYDCAASPQFTAANVAEKIQQKRGLSTLGKLIYQYVIIPTAKTGLDTQREAYAWQKSRPTQGRGRTDTFNPTKITVFNLPDDGTIGTVDLPAIWNQRAREGLWLHWDGNNNSIRERNYAAAMAVGATPSSVLPDHFKVVTDYVLGLPATAFPFDIDSEKAGRGEEIYRLHCADCHAFGSERVGKVTPIDEIGTDPHRLHSFTEQLVDNFHTVHEGRFQFDAYRKTQGYANLPIDGIWVRAPYLHNGSVPTLWDLLQKPEDRPKAFYRGYDVYDPQEMGFIHEGPEAKKVGWLQSKDEPGNGNGGHLYGTDLDLEEKWDLIEFLKTL